MVQAPNINLSINDLILSPIGKENIPDDFDCGDDDLNGFLVDDALDYEKEQIARTTVAIFDNKVVGFFSLCADCISLKVKERKNHIESRNVKIRKEWPALKIARLAVDKNFRNMGIGKALIDATIFIAQEWSERIGIRFISVDAYPASVEFYEKLFFLPNKYKTELYKDPLVKEKHNTISMRLDLQPTYYNPYK